VGWGAWPNSNPFFSCRRDALRGCAALLGNSIYKQCPASAVDGGRPAQAHPPAPTFEENEGPAGSVSGLRVAQRRPVKPNRQKAAAYSPTEPEFCHRPLHAWMLAFGPGEHRALSSRRTRRTIHPRKFAWCNDVNTRTSPPDLPPWQYRKRGAATSPPLNSVRDPTFESLDVFPFFAALAGASMILVQPIPGHLGAAGLSARCCIFPNWNGANSPRTWSFFFLIFDFVFIVGVHAGRSRVSRARPRRAICCHQRRLLRDVHGPGNGALFAPPPGVVA